MIEIIYTVIIAILVSIVTFLWLDRQKLIREVERLKDQDPYVVKFSELATRLRDFECLGFVFSMSQDERDGYIELLREILKFVENDLDVSQKKLDLAVYQSNIATLQEFMRGKSNRSEVNKALIEFALDNKKHEKQFHLFPGVNFDDWTFEAMHKTLTGDEWDDGCD